MVDCFTAVLSRVSLLPIQDALKIANEYVQKSKPNFANMQRLSYILDTRTKNSQIVSSDIREKVIALLLLLKTCCNGHYIMSESKFKDTFANFKAYVWIEAAKFLDDKTITIFLDRYSNYIAPILLFWFLIIPRSEEFQCKAINLYKNKIDIEDNIEDQMYRAFYFALHPKARALLRSLFPRIIQYLILDELDDRPTKSISGIMQNNYNLFSQLPSEEVFDFALLNLTTAKSLSDFMFTYKDVINDIPSLKFVLLVCRYIHLVDQEFGYYKEDNKCLSSIELFRLYKEKFYQLGFNKTKELLSELFSNQYDPSPESVEILIYFRSQLFEGETSLPKNLIATTIDEFSNECLKNEYTIEDFHRLVTSIDNGRVKLLHDDFIEACIACRQLMEKGIIDTSYQDYQILKEKIVADINNRIIKDGTYEGSIPLSIVIRLVKGNLTFRSFYTTRTYKGLLYLSKINRPVLSADDITERLTDLQLAKLNLRPILKWPSNLARPDSSADSPAFIERMGLQLYLFFGREVAEYLLTSKMAGNFMESLFDGIDYKIIEVSEKGAPIPNRALFDYLFGGHLDNPASLMNLIIKGETKEEDGSIISCFSELCNNFNTIRAECGGYLSTRRIIDYLAAKKLNIEFKPNERLFRKALLLTGLYDPKLLQIGVDLCNEAEKRVYSTIPKIEGQLGKFTYQILDLDDPKAIATGYVSRCCFTINGESFSALEHSMKSKNGRILWVYYNKRFISQSWIWRNGDVVCFDSEEAGCARHGELSDKDGLISVYKLVASQILSTSKSNEPEEARVKAVTIGKSDHRFNGLEPVTIPVPRPIEEVRVYDSNKQWILAGNLPQKPKYGEVEAIYTDPRKAIITCDLNSKMTDVVYESVSKANALRYRIHGIEESIDYQNYTKLVLGRDWYILIRQDGGIEEGAIQFPLAIAELEQAKKELLSPKSIRFAPLRKGGENL